MAIGTHDYYSAVGRVDGKWRELDYNEYNSGSDTYDQVVNWNLRYTKGVFAANSTDIDNPGYSFVDSPASGLLYSLLTGTPKLALISDVDIDVSLVANSSTTKTLTLSAVNSGSATGEISIYADGLVALESTTSVLEFTSSNIMRFTSNLYGFDFNSSSSNMTVDVGGYISLDSADSCNFTVASDSGFHKTLLLQCTNIGAGNGNLTLFCDGDLTQTLSANSPGAQTLALSCVNAGAGTGLITITADDAITLDSTAGNISLDGVTSSNFTVTGNSAGDQTLTLAATNVGAGVGNVSISADGTISAVADIDILIEASSLLDLFSDDAINLEAHHAFTISGTETSSIRLDASSASDQTLTIACTNGGAGNGLLSITADDQITISSTAGRVRIDPNISVGTAPLGYIKNYFGGNFTSNGASTTASAQFFDGSLIGATGDTSSISATRMNNTITTQNAGETIGIVSQLYLVEPDITIGSDTITTAATLYIATAPTEGLGNYALYVNSGSSYFNGSLTSTSTVQCTTLKATNLTDNYLPYHVSDASGLADSGYSWVSNRAVISTNLAVGAAPIGYVKNYFYGNFTSDGSLDRTYAQYWGGRITGVAGDTYGQFGSRFSNAITTQNNAEVVGIISQAYFEEPIIVNGTDTVNLATTIYIANAPTEGVTNYSLFVASGNVGLGGTLAFTGASRLITSASANLSITTTTSGTLAATSAGALTLSGALGSSLAVAANAAGDQYLTISSVNAGAGQGLLDIYADDGIALYSINAGLDIDVETTSHWDLGANAAGDQTLRIKCTNAGAGEGLIAITADDDITFTARESALTFNDAVNTALDPDYYTATSIVGAFNEIAVETGANARIDATIAASSTVTIDTIAPATVNNVHKFGLIEYMFTIRKDSIVAGNDCDCGVLRVKIFGTGVAPEIDLVILGQAQVLSFSFDVSVSGSDLLIEVVNSEASQLIFKALKRSIFEYVQIAEA